MHLYSVLCRGCSGFCIPTALPLIPALVFSPFPPYDTMLNALFDVLEAQFQLNCLTIVGLALVVYDHCLTFSLEVRCITRVIHFLSHTRLTFAGTILLVGILVAFAGALPSGKLSYMSAIILNYPLRTKHATQSRYLPLLVLLCVTLPLLYLFEIDDVTRQCKCHRCGFPDCYYCS